MKKNLILSLGFVSILALGSCDGGTKPSPESRTYETGYSSETTVTSTEEDDPFINNALATGECPYSCSNERGNQSSITVRTSSESNFSTEQSSASEIF